MRDSNSIAAPADYEEFKRAILAPALSAPIECTAEDIAAIEEAGEAVGWDWRTCDRSATGKAMQEAIRAILQAHPGKEVSGVMNVLYIPQDFSMGEARQITWAIAQKEFRWADPVETCIKVHSRPCVAVGILAALKTREPGELRRPAPVFAP